MEPSPVQVNIFATSKASILFRWIIIHYLDVYSVCVDTDIILLQLFADVVDDNYDANMMCMCMKC